MTIADHQPDDTAAVTALIVGIQRDEFGIEIDAAAQPDLAAVRSFYQHGRGGFWVARHGQHIIGTLALLDIGNGAVALRKMFVDAHYRGRRWDTADKLLAHALGHAAAHGVGHVYLGTMDKFQAALRFYEKH